ncbi:MAG: zinc ribbon domain-containing protein [Acidobacteriota bacterium]
MFCDRCGTKLSPHAHACPSCGKVMVSMMPPRKGIAGHVRMLGILWLAYAAVHISPALAILMFFDQRFFPPDMPPFVFNFFPMIGGLLLFTGVSAGLVGMGLLMRQSWARVAALVVAAVNLIAIPFGTVLGIYTLWALLPAEHEEEYRALTRVA